MVGKSKSKIIMIILSIFTFILLGTSLFATIYGLLNNNSIFNEFNIYTILLLSSTAVLQFISLILPINISTTLISTSFNWYQTLIIYVAVVIVSSIIIYIITRCFKFDSTVHKGTTYKIDEHSKKKKNKKNLILNLFFKPFILLGGVCYKMCNDKMPFIKYIILSIVGVIPTFFLSFVLGQTLKYFVINDISIWWYLLLLFGVLVILFFGNMLYEKIFYKELTGTPDSIYYYILFTVFHIIVTRKVKATFERGEIDKIKGPYVLLSNHGSFFDVYFLSRLAHKHKFSFILNKYYFKEKPAKYILSKMGAIPKKLFSPDSETIKKTLRSIKLGYPVLMCPEGRLSIDGTNYQIRNETGKLLKQLKVPVVIVTINGAYPTNPKWRSHRIKGRIHTEVKKIITKEEIDSLSVNEINEIVNEYISYNDFEYAKDNHLTYKGKNKAENLESVLYHCPKCGNNYTLYSDNNTFGCKECGFKVDILDDYSFTDNELGFKNIHDWYEKIVEYERQNIINGDINLSCNVRVKKYNIKSKKKDEDGFGVCTLTSEGFTFKGKLNEEVSFFLDYNTLKGLPFSAGIQFECYYNDELYYFYPLENHLQVCRWALIIDEIVREREENERK